MASTFQRETPLLLASNLPTLAVLVPVLALILLGAAMKRCGFPGNGFWRPAERLTYFVLFPALIATTLASADLSDTPWPAMAAAICLSIVVAVAALFGASPWLRVDGPRLTSLCQGAIRMNTYVGLSVAGGLAGEEGLAHAAVAIAVIVPLVNLTCVVALARLGESPSEKRPGVLWSLITNPLIVASLLGVALNVAGVSDPPVVGPVAKTLGRAALPLGLLAVGAALRWEAIGAIRLPELAVSAVKLALLPTICACLLSWMQVDGVAAMVGVLFTALPTAPSSYLLARQMGGDAAVMAGLVTLQTAAAFVTLPLVLALATQ